MNCASDQYGFLWLIFKHNGEDWALGIDERDEPQLRRVSNSEVWLDPAKPKSMRKLTIQSLIPEKRCFCDQTGCPNDKGDLCDATAQAS